MSEWRPASPIMVSRLWPMARSVNLAYTPKEFERFCAAAPWRVRVSAQGDAMALVRWREHLDILSIRGVWAGPHRIADVVEEACRVARSQGFSAVVSPLLSEASAVEYRAAGMVECEPLVALQGSLHGLLARGGREGVRIVRAKERDLGALTGIDAACFDEFWRYGEAELRRALETERTVLAFLEDAPVAYATASVGGSVCTLGRLAVAPDARRQGVASALVSEVGQWASRGGANVLSLCTQESNSASRALYRRLGLVEVQERYALLRIEA